MNWKLKMKIVERFRTQAEFAPVVGRDDAYVSRVIRGYRKLSPDAASKWAAALKCDVNEFL